MKTIDIILIELHRQDQDWGRFRWFDPTDLRETRIDAQRLDLVALAAAIDAVLRPSETPAEPGK